MSDQVCIRCVMDTTDPGISFDENGICSHCARAEGLLAPIRLSQDESARRLDAMASQIRRRAGNREYNCILGLSGGVDSSYTAYIAHKMGLKPLAVHFDNGWNSEVAVSNIKSIVSKLGFDLVTYVINWDEFRDIQRAFIKASVVDIEMITDHAIMAAMYSIARKHNISVILSGQNYATEHCMPKAWIWNKQDLVNLRAIHDKFGEVRLTTFPMLSTWKYLVYRRILFDYVLPLNALNYRKTEAMAIMERELGWRYYGGKHYESVFTKFYQAYILPTKFNIDKRKPHLSALIRNGELTRTQALEELAKPLYSAEELSRDKEYVLKKLGFSESEFERMMAERPVSHDAFPNDRALVDRLMRFYSAIKKTGLVKGKR